MDTKELNDKIRGLINAGKKKIAHEIAEAKTGRWIDLEHAVPYSKQEWKSLKDSEKDACIHEALVKLFSDDAGAILAAIERGVGAPDFGLFDHRGREAGISVDIWNARIVRDTVRLVAGVPVKVRFFSSKGKIERVLVMMENGICAYVDTPCSVSSQDDFLKYIIGAVFRLSPIACERRTVAYLQYVTGAVAKPVLTPPDDRDELPKMKNGRGFNAAWVDADEPSEYPAGDGCETSAYADDMADELAMRKKLGV